MTEKITGVCVDIPTVIKEAKAKKQPFEWQYKTCGITFDASNLNDAEKFWIEKQCQLLTEPVVTLADITPNHYKNQRFVPAPEWISVEERLPEEGVPVLATNVESLNPFVVMSSWDSHASLYEFNKFRFKKYVTHWMPLPAPPKDCSST